MFRSNRKPTPLSIFFLQDTKKKIDLFTKQLKEKEKRMHNNNIIYYSNDLCGRFNTL